MDKKLSSHLDTANYDFNAEYYINHCAIHQDLCIKLSAFIINIKFKKYFKNADVKDLLRKLRQAVLCDYSVNYIFRKKGYDSYLERRAAELRELDISVFNYSAQMAEDTIMEHVKKCITQFIEADILKEEASEADRKEFNQKITTKHTLLNKVINSVYGKRQSEKPIFSFYEIGSSKQSNALTRKEDAEILQMILILFLLDRKYYFNMAFNNVLSPYFAKRKEDLTRDQKLELEKFQKMEFELEIPHYKVEQIDSFPTNDGESEELDGERTMDDLYRDLLVQFSKTSTNINTKAQQINKQYTSLTNLIKNDDAEAQGDRIFSLLQEIKDGLTETDEYKFQSTFLEGAVWGNKKSKQNTTKQIVNFASGAAGSLGLQLGLLLNSDSKVKPNGTKALKEIGSLLVTALGTAFLGPIGGSLFGGIANGMMFSREESSELKAINGLKTHIDGQFKNVNRSLAHINSNILLVQKHLLSISRRIDTRFEFLGEMTQENFNQVFAKLDSIIQKIQYSQENREIKLKFEEIMRMQENLLIKIENINSEYTNDLKNGEVKYSYLLDSNSGHRIYSPYDFEEFFLLEFGNIIKKFYDLKFDIRDDDYELIDSPSIDSLCYMLRGSGTLYFLEAMSMIQRITTKLLQIGIEYYKTRSSFRLIYSYLLSFSDRKSNNKSYDILFSELHALIESRTSVYLALTVGTLIKEKMFSSVEVKLYNEIQHFQTDSFFYGGYTLAQSIENKLVIATYNENEKRMMIDKPNSKGKFEYVVFFPKLENRDSKNFDLRFWEDPDRDVLFKTYVYFGEAKGKIIVESKAHAKEKVSFFLQKHIGKNKDSFMEQLVEAYDEDKSLNFNNVKYTPFNPKPEIIQSSENPENGLILEFFPYTMIILNKYYKPSTTAPKSDLFVRLVKEENPDQMTKTSLVFHGSEVQDEYARLDVSELTFD